MSENIPKFQGCRLIVHLIAQSPQIHFQHRETGATLRGSELKPKLDAFLYKKMGREYEKALDYKVKLICERPPEKVEIGNLRNVKKGKEESYSIFYGNTGREEKLAGVWSDPKLEILCFDEGLRSLIEENLTEFFCVTNFGMMQNKGFGSYSLQEAGYIEPKRIRAWLAEYYGVKRCWYCSGEKNRTKKERSKTQFLWIKNFYGIMKSGQNFVSYERSFLFEYMHKNEQKAMDTSNIKKSIDNEKAWMKQQGIAPAIFQKDNDMKYDRMDENSRYVRAFMGMAATQSWQGESKKETISIADPEKEIERIESPVYFKINENFIYFVIREIPDQIYGKVFQFSGRKTGMLSTPEKSDFTDDRFDTEAFMSAYVSYYNSQNQLNKNFKQKIGLVKEWRCEG